MSTGRAEPVGSAAVEPDRAEPAGPAISAEGLVRTFGETRAVDGVSLSIRPAEIYGFLGPNGAGKTTVTRMLCTMLLPTAGEAVVAGYSVRTQAEQVRRRIGVALQSTSLDDKQTGVEMLRLQGRFYGMGRKAIDQRLAEVRDLIDIGDALNRRVGTYSGGMRRRLDLALSLMHLPQILFLDEPTTGLDPVSRATVWQEVRRLNRELGMTVFLTTQYLEEADELADRVGIINAGTIVAEDTPERLKRSVGIDLIVATVEGDPHCALEALQRLPLVDRAEVNGAEIAVSVQDGPTALSPVAVALTAVEGLSVRNLSLRTPTLDDVFLHVTGGRIAGEAAPTASGTESA